MATNFARHATRFGVGVAQSSLATHKGSPVSLTSALEKLKLLQLKQLSRNCGLSISGTKPSLVSALVHAVHDKANNKPFETPTRLLSVDLGLRNIAFCQFKLDSVHGAPQIEKWELVGLEGLEENRSLMQPVFASMALHLVKSAFLKGNITPDVILIEQQRIRSGGSSSVCEHIAKINILEGMIHAILQTYMEERSLDIRLESVPAKGVMKYWIRDREKLEQMSTGRRYQLTKKAKVTMAETLLLSPNGSSFTLAPEVNPFDSESSLKVKRDDLCDSLLQGLGWIIWQRNLHQLGHVNNIDQLQHVMKDIDDKYESLLAGPS
jgi:cruciform cutting endonuclease 1